MSAGQKTYSSFCSVKSIIDNLCLSKLSLKVRDYELDSNVPYQYNTTEVLVYKKLRNDDHSTNAIHLFKLVYQSKIFSSATNTNSMPLCLLMMTIPHYADL